ncbi:hypothetical protein [Desulfopila sp. IMCC35008]|uniref:hypothetical protein n=1 Tax=Desulfopila sp. IMCC35008 TaxID=2653858 RepID=UPI0013D17E85|nr:hypothetical protein [Desulfopila sp. IMCC35008]
MERIMKLIGLTVVVCLLSGCVEKQVSVNNGDLNRELESPAEKAKKSKNEAGKVSDLKDEVLQMLPEPVEGFSWSLFKGVAIQRPVNWNEYSQGGTYCSSVESVQQNGIFQTGVTIQIIRDTQKNKNVSAALAAGVLINDIEKLKENRKIFINFNKHDNLETIVYRYRNAPQNMTPIIVHKYFQVSEKEDFMNIVTFETTEEKWDEYWKKYGEVILSKVVVYGVE